jgi:hypothetical protein
MPSPSICSDRLKLNSSTPHSRGERGHGRGEQNRHEQPAEERTKGAWFQCAVGRGAVGQAGAERGCVRSLHPCSAHCRCGNLRCSSLGSAALQSAPHATPPIQRKSERRTTSAPRTPPPLLSSPPFSSPASVLLRFAAFFEWRQQPQRQQQEQQQQQQQQPSRWACCQDAERGVGRWPCGGRSVWARRRMHDELSCIRRPQSASRRRPHVRQRTQPGGEATGSSDKRHREKTKGNGRRCRKDVVRSKRWHAPSPLVCWRGSGFGSQQHEFLTSRGTSPLERARSHPHRPADGRRALSCRPATLAHRSSSRTRATDEAVQGQSDSSPIQ